MTTATTNGSSKRVHHPLGGTTAKHFNAYSDEPHNLILATDPAHVLYQERVEDPISRESVLLAATHGIIQPVVVRLVDGQLGVNAGRQRVKRALVVNALIGKHAYTGPVKAVHAAIREFSKDAEFVKAIATVCPGGLRVPLVARNGGDLVSARALMAVENADRQGDNLERRIRSAQRDHELGMPDEDIATNYMVSLPTVKRWLQADTSQPRPKKTRGKASRPSLKAQKSFIAQHRPNATKREQVFMDWLDGKADLADLVELFVKK